MKKYAMIIFCLTGLFFGLTGCIQIITTENPLSDTAAEDKLSDKTEEKKKLPETKKAATPHPGRNGALTDEEMELAKVAWKYFENNYQANTGMVNAVDQYPSTTMWDMSSYLGGMTAAYEFGIISKNQFDVRLMTLLGTLNRLDFFRSELPNKVYHTQTAQKVNYANQPGEIGFSALDLGRMLIWLKIIKERYPQHADAIDNFVLRWDFRRVVDKNGLMFGAILQNSETMYVQEGRLGYEEYGAKGFQLWGFDTTLASKPEPYSLVTIFGVEIPYDTRDPRHLVAHNYVVCESYVLDGMELNWDLAEDRSAEDMFTQTGCPMILPSAFTTCRKNAIRKKESSLPALNTSWTVLPILSMTPFTVTGFPGTPSRKKARMCPSLPQSLSKAHSGFGRCGIQIIQMECMN